MHRLFAVLLSVTALLLALTTPVAVVAASAATGSAPSAAERRAPVSVTLVGRGYGHGKGLSQYGAQARARAGQSYRTIVQHYYPGTRWGTIAGTVAVLITGDTSTDVVVDARSGLRVRGLASGRSWVLPATVRGVEVKQWRITPTSGGAGSKVDFRTGTWHSWRTTSGAAEFSAGGSAIRLRTPDGAVSYRGILRSAKANSSGSSRDTVNLVSMESYLRGVVPQEVPALWDPDAVRAQAVAARTYAAFERTAAPRGRYYQLCDTAHCQVYGGASVEHPAASRAVAATAKRIVTAGGKPAFAQFSASNGGYSAAGDFSYLKARPDPYDDLAAWKVRFSGSQITRHWSGLGDLRAVTVTKRDGRGAYGGRVLELVVRGSDSSVRVSGSTFASYLGLRANLFRVAS